MENYTPSNQNFQQKFAGPNRHPDRSPRSCFRKKARGAKWRDLALLPLIHLSTHPTLVHFLPRRGSRRDTSQRAGTAGSHFSSLYTFQPTSAHSSPINSERGADAAPFELGSYLIGAVQSTNPVLRLSISTFHRPAVQCLLHPFLHPRPLRPYKTCSYEPVSVLGNHRACLQPPAEISSHTSHCKV